MFLSFSELIEDPVKEEKERRRKAVEKWTKESNDKFASGYKNQAGADRSVYPDGLLSQVISLIRVSFDQYFCFSLQVGYIWQKIPKAR